MNLSQSFSIDVDAPWVESHNSEAREVLRAHEADKPIRVPLLCGEWPGQHGFYADEFGLDYTKYYTDADEMLRVQLEAARRRRELPIYDIVLGAAPESWPVSVDLWPIVPAGWFGCELMYRRDAPIAHRSLELTKKECIQLDMPDPRTGGILEVCDRFWRHMKDRYEGKLTFLGRPVGPFRHGLVMNGVFSLALDLRGVKIMSDMHEDPDFAKQFLLKVGTWCDTLERTWAGLAEEEVGPFMTMDHGIEMLSAEMYEEFIVPVVKEMNRRRGTRASSALHYCGAGTHLFPVLKRHFGLTQLHGLTFPIIDIARVRSQVGEDIQITVFIEDSIIHRGPPERVRQVVKDLMASGAKGKGRFELAVGDMLKGVPLEHRLALYEAVKEFGKY